MESSDKDISYAVAKAAGNFSTNYQVKLREYESKLDPAVHDCLHDLGIEIKTAFDDIVNLLSKK